MIARILGLLWFAVVSTACVHDTNSASSSEDLTVTQPASSDEELAAATEDTENPTAAIDTTNGIPEVEGPFVWGDNVAVKKFDRFYISGQPDAGALDMAKTENVHVVVNLREANEMTWDEETYVKKLGMIYYNVPVSAESSIDTSVFADIDEIQARHNGNILIHDSTGNRSAAWFTSHLATEQSLTLEKSLEIGKSLGLSGDKNIQEVQSYIATYENGDSESSTDPDSNEDESADNDSEAIEE